ncbi:unnamed protein product [Durusdinium trenchii]|uniref:CSD domain-containing protein n=1 Tax=Durusdinium trenchii TaxID=1381693 RepID=A0ABP0SHG0_9DINO
MQRGYVTKWLVHRNFGFLQPEGGGPGPTRGGGEDVFVHGSVLRDATALAAGDRVEYQLAGKGANGAKPTASSCKRIEKDPRTAYAFPCADWMTSVGEFLKTAGVGAAELERTAQVMAPFITYSSVRCPFLVISQAGLLEGMRAPNASELSILLKLLVAYAQGCEVQRRFLLADFEGEMLGYCGELSTAALLETKVLDQNLRPLSANALGHAPLGLLIDLRSTPCIDAFRPLMESPKIMKVMWGADADFESLLHQEIPIHLKIQPQAVTDLQLAFSSGDRRLGMARMLERLPADLMSPLPDKKQIDWHAFHSQNRRALHLPMSFMEATYAMDDLHRIEAILATVKPSSSSYQAARKSTDEVLADVKADPCGWRSLERNECFYHKSLGVRKLSCAVRLVRHSVALRRRERNGLDLGEKKEKAQQIEKWAASELAAAGVVIPEDLSFAGDDLNGSSQTARAGVGQWWRSAGQMKTQPED